MSVPGRERKSVMSEIRLKNITKSYGSHVAIPGLDLDIPKGSFVNSSRTIGMRENHNAARYRWFGTGELGEVSLSGKTVYSSETGTFVAPERRGLGFIFQSYALWPNMKVERNITLALSEAGKPAQLINERLTEALAKVHLTGLSDRYPSELSGGQQQRVAVARLIAARNTILLMDEPLSNLDAKLRTEMRTELKRLHCELGATTVYVTHDQVEALTMSDIVVVMRDGLIQQQGSPYEIYHNPANLFVAEFIGDPKINLFEGDVKQHGSDATLEIQGLMLGLRGASGLPTGPITVGIRPENIEIHYQMAPDCIPAEVDFVQPTGSQTLISLRARDQRVTVLIPRFEMSLPARSVFLRLSPDHLTFFDAAGCRIPVSWNECKTSTAA